MKKLLPYWFVTNNLTITSHKNADSPVEYSELAESEWLIIQTPTALQKLPETNKLLRSINIVNNIKEDTLEK